MLTHYHVKRLFLSILFFCTPLSFVHASDWNIELIRDELNLECSLPDHTLGDILGTSSNGVCDIIKQQSDADLFLKAVLNGFGGTFEEFMASLLGELRGTFDLAGGAIKCNINGVDSTTSALSEFCQRSLADILNTPITPEIIWGLYSIEAEGIFDDTSENDSTLDDRTYPSGLTNKDMYADVNCVLPDGTTETCKGGKLLAQVVEDPTGSVSTALSKWDKPTIALTDMAYKMSGQPVPSKIKLPTNKLEAMRQADTATKLQEKLHINWVETLRRHTAALRKIYATDIDPGTPISMTLAEYYLEESRESIKYFKSDDSGIATLIDSAKRAKKAELATDILLMQGEKGYISDPSEARKALVSMDQKIPFTWASILQQEKKKALLLKYALKWKRTAQKIELIKQLAVTNASIFRDDIAKNDIENLLGGVDASITY